MCAHPHKMYLSPEIRLNQERKMEARERASESWVSGLVWSFVRIVIWLVAKHWAFSLLSVIRRAGCGYGFAVYHVLYVHLFIQLPSFYQRFSLILSNRLPAAPAATMMPKRASRSVCLLDYINDEGPRPTNTWDCVMISTSDRNVQVIGFNSRSG